jgi:hypothetical protein
MSGLLFAVGCSQQSGEPPTPAPSANGLKYLLDREPAEAQDVVGVRETAKNGDAVVIVGRIGGSDNPWIENRAAFKIVDLSLKACSDIPGDACPIPWDYCCETHKLPTATALVKVVDEQGKLVKEDARQLLGVKELATVVIEGKAERDQTGNLTILATHVFIKQK